MNGVVKIISSKFIKINLKNINNLGKKSALDHLRTMEVFWGD